MEEKIKILLCEDDENLGILLREYLVNKKYEVDLRPDGEEGFNAFVKSRYDLCIFDVMMPKVDGFELAKNIRVVNENIPIIFLTAKSMKEDILQGFKLGADDYLTKPFSMEELTSRIESILKRTKNKKIQNISTFQFGIFTFDSQTQVLKWEDEKRKLTTKESELLKLLAQNQNALVEREFALKKIWIDDNYFNARSMDVYITKLRKLLKPDPNINIINIHGKGYKLITPIES